MTGAPLLKIQGLVTEFRTESGTVRAVKGVDLTVEAGKTVALAGESGSRKSLTSLSIMRLIPPAVGSITGGEILFRGRDAPSPIWRPSLNIGCGTFAATKSR